MPPFPAAKPSWRLVAAGDFNFDFLASSAASLRSPWHLLRYPEGVKISKPRVAPSFEALPWGPAKFFVPQKGFISLTLSGARNAPKPLWGMELNRLVPRVGDAPTLGWRLKPLWLERRNKAYFPCSA